MIDILIGDCRERLRDLPDRHFQTVVTSPPYFGLRDYGTASWDGGDPACDHLGAPMRTSANIKANYGAGRNDVKNALRREPMGQVCSKCGAARVDAQIGLEPTPDEFAAAVVDVFRLLRDKLRDDGTVWLNLGDSYAQTGGPGVQGYNSQRIGRADVPAQVKATSQKPPPGLKSKDLMGIPWLVAFALRADGWFLRQEIIWHKPNPMPESVLDRCTKAHEQVFLLAKSGDATIWRARDSREWSSTPDLTERLPSPTDEEPDRTVARWRAFDYLFDADAIAEASVYQPGATANVDRPKGYFDGKRNDEGRGAGVEKAFKAIRETRNKRSVWTIPPGGFDGAHFATMPAELARLCILAGSRPGDAVLDPFGGAGTTALVADGLGREATMIELNPEYAAMASARMIGGQESLFTGVRFR